MKHTILLSLLFSFFSSGLYSQSTISSIEIGDHFVIGEVPKNSYKHIRFPKANFIIKKGGIPNYNTIIGQEVEIISTKEKKGRLIATLQLTSKKLFFNSHKFIEVEVEEALRQKELLRI